MILARSHRTRDTHRGRFSVGLAGALMVAVTLAAGPLHADTGTSRADSGGTGAVADKLSLPLALSWKYTSVYSPYNPASPTIAGDTVYFASGTRVYALDSQTGALKWRYPEDQPLDTTIFTSPSV